MPNQFTEYAGPKVVVIGGGTGNFTVLSGLKHHVGEGLTAIVGMADDGGSTGVLRDAYGSFLPPGDVRQCLVALSTSPEDVRALFNHRFPEGDEQGVAPGLVGQNFGNLFLLAAEQTTGSIADAISVAARTLAITGAVVPATCDNRRLVITLPTGTVIKGEHAAEETTVPSLKGAQVTFDQASTRINPEAEKAIRSADLVVIAPGDLYTSIAPALVVQGMADALRDKAIVLVINLVNRERHTRDFTVQDYVEEVERLSAARVRYVLYNIDTPDAATLERYASEGERPVVLRQEGQSGVHYKLIGRKLLSRQAVYIDPADALGHTRSLIRHDPAKVAYAILGVLYDHVVRDAEA